MKTRGLLGLVLLGSVWSGTVLAQTWPEYHLTNGWHHTSYGVETYDASTPKYLYIDEGATLWGKSAFENPPGLNLENIADQNQIILNGGKLAAYGVDENDFIWNSGEFELSGKYPFEPYTSLFGIDKGSGKYLHLYQAQVEVDSLSLPTGNSFLLGGGSTLTIRELDLTGADFRTGLSWLNVSGLLRNLPDGWHGELEVEIKGPSARWEQEGEYLMNHTTHFLDGAKGVFGDLALEENLALSGAGIELSADELVVGQRGEWRDEVEVSITDGAQVYSQRSTIGLGGGEVHAPEFSDNNIVVVSGSNSVWNAGYLTVGQYGNDNRLVVSNQATLVSTGTTIGYDGVRHGTGGNSMVVDGTGTVWRAGGIRVGVDSEGSLTIQNGAIVEAGGVSAGSSSYWGGRGSLSVRGAGTQLLVHGDVDVGIGANGSFSVSDGAEVECLNATVGGGFRQGSGSLGVSGAGSKMKVNGELYIGVNGLGVGSSAGVGSGGEMTIGSLGIRQGSSFGLNAGGRLIVNGDFDASMEGFNFNADSTLSVTGAVSSLSLLETNRRLETPNLLGDIEVHGVFAPGNSAADSVVDGNLVLAADGTLEMELGGYGLGTEYDRLTVTGSSDLSGILMLSFLDGFTATNGASFDLFNWDGGVSGGFSEITVSGYEGAIAWDTSRLYTDGTLSVIPEPQSVLLILSAFPLMLLRRRRQTRHPVLRTRTADISEAEPLAWR